MLVCVPYVRREREREREREKEREKEVSAANINNKALFLTSRLLFLILGYGLQSSRRYFIFVPSTIYFFRMRFNFSILSYNLFILIGNNELLCY